jgi:hypothetical protein
MLSVGRAARWVSIPLLGVLVVAVVLSGSAVLRTSSPVLAGAVGGPCQFQEADQPTNVALCETFDQPAGIGDRGGDLNGTLWGVSRMLGNVNFGQGQYNAAIPTTLQKCGQAVQVQPPNDVAICNGQVAESVTDGIGFDNGTVTDLAMYPKQPFDIAGRTGTIAFDVSDDSAGNHRAWPEIWYTDQPVPTAFDHFSSLQSVPKNGLGVRFAGACGAGNLSCRTLCPSIPSDVAVITVDSAVVVNNYIANDSFMDVGTGPISVKQTGCVRESSGPGNMNHFELRVSQHEVDVYGTDAGNPTGPMTQLAVISNMSLTLTRGLLWMEDVHYNGNKDTATGPDAQGTHTFTWDNFGFDGPVLPRDLAFDAKDSLTPVPNYPMVNLGWITGPNDPAPLSVTVPGVYNIANAAAALLTFNYYTYNPVTVTYRVNNGAWQSQPWLFGTCFTYGCGAKTIAVPVPLTDLQAGTNIVQFKSTDGAVISNVDLVLAGAAGTLTSPPPTTTTTTKPVTTTTATTVPVTTTIPPVTTTIPPVTTTTSTTTPPAPKIIGSTIVGPLVDSGNINSMHGTRVVTGSAGGTVQSLSVYVDAVVAAPNNKYQVGIYRTDSTGAPSTLVVSSSTGNLTPFSWNTMTITATLQANTQYWLEYNTNGNNNLHYVSAPAFGTWPASVAGSQLKAFSIYATLQ